MNIKPFLPLIVAMLIFAACVTAYGVMYTRIASGIDRIGVVLANTEALSARDALVRSQQLFLEDTTEAREVLSTFVLDDSQVVDAIEIVEDTARSNGTEFVISTVNTVGGSWESHEGIEINFSARGSFSALANTIATLEALPIAARLERGSLEASTDGWLGTFTVTFVKEK